MKGRSGRVGIVVVMVLSLLLAGMTRTLATSNLIDAAPTGYWRQNVSASARSFWRLRASTASNPPPNRAPRLVLTSQIARVAPRITTRSSSPIRHRQFRATIR